MFAKKSKLILLSIAMASMALSGCIGGSGSSTLYVKDALTDEASEVHVTFTWSLEDSNLERLALKYIMADHTRTYETEPQGSGETSVMPVFAEQPT